MKEYTKRDSCMTMEEVIERNTGMSLKAFLTPQPNPYIHNMDRAVEFFKKKVNDAAEEKEILQIKIVGDYDADGMNASAILYDAIISYLKANSLGHSGNTRLYIIRNGKVNLITHDHTQAYELLQEGKIDSETYYVHDGRLKLTSGIGKIINPRIDTISGKLQEQDLVLMTTDGIHYALRPDAMSEIILNSPPEGTEATNALVNAAKNIVKYPDNMSAMLIYMPSGFL